MVRTYITALAALFVLVSANVASAFGLGELTLKSYLNQPFNAEIEITDTGDLNKDEIKPSLASQEDFSNVGVQREYFLTQLRFEVIFGEDRNYIKITSKAPVTEPYLDFLVELLWPEGRLLREYTVLLDPPSYASQHESNAAPVVQLDDTAPVVQPQANEQSAEGSDMSAEQSAAMEPSGSEGGENEEVVQEAETATTDMMASASSQTEAASVEETTRTITTQPKDTLWGIASRERPNESVSVQQTMLAIKRLNPDAFEHDNINYLKKNQVLRIPSEHEIRSMATREALGVVADQNREWAGRTLANGGTLPMDTAKLVGSREVTPMGQGAGSSDQMKVVAESATNGSAVGAYDGQGNAASADASAAAGRQNAQLASDVAALKSQVETSQKLIALKDKQIAELQARLEKQGADTSTSVDKQVGRAQSAQTQQKQAETSPDTEANKMADNTSTEDMSDEEALAQAQADAAEASASQETEFKADEKAAKSLETEKASQKPAQSALASKKQTSSSNTMLYAIIGIVVLLLIGGGLGFFLYKKRVANTAPAYEGDMGMDGGDLDDLEGGFGDLDELSDGEDYGEEGESSNVLTEADTYISFNRHAQAIELLKNAIAKGEDSIAVKMKLLEAYAGAGDQAAFDALRAEVLGEDASQADAIDALESSAAEGSQDEDEFDISLDDLASDLDASFVDSDSSDEGESLDDLESSLDLGGDSEAASVETDTVVEEAQADEEVDSDFDLDLDFSEDDQATEDTASLEDTVILEADGEDSDDLGLDLDLDLDTGSESEEDDSLDLSLDELSFDEGSPSEQESDDSLDSKSDSGDLDLSFEEEDSLDLNLDAESDNADDGLDLNLDEETDDGALDLSFEDDSEGTENDLDLNLEEETAGDDDVLDLSLEGDSDEELELDFTEESVQEDEISLEAEDDDALDLSGDLDLDDGLDLSLDDAADEPELSTEEPENEGEGESLFEGGDDDFDLPDEGNEAATKLDLARAYIDMGDDDGARDILEEVLSEGDDAQKAEANELLSKL